MEALNDRSRTPWFDPGWLFLAAGLAVLVASVLVPAAEDLRRAQWQRDRALAVEAHRQSRLARYEEYLAALETQDPALVESLAESQLRQIPQDRNAVPGAPSRGTPNLSVFPGLEPPELHLAEYHPTRSLLASWTTDPGKRVWLLVGGGICVLLGLLPASRGWGRVEATTPTLPTP